MKMQDTTPYKNTLVKKILLYLLWHLTASVTLTRGRLHWNKDLTGENAIN